MATEFIMPKLGLTMEEGTIIEWLVADGDTVAAGAPVLRIETDKTETEVDAAESGRVQILGAVGATFACGERIGWFLADGEDAPATTAPAAPTPVAADAGSGSGERTSRGDGDNGADGADHRLPPGQAPRRRAFDRPAFGSRHRPGRTHRDG